MSLYDSNFQAVARAAILAVLATNSDNTPVTGHPNPNRSLPYIFIGESEHGDHPIGQELTIIIHVYSDVEGAHEVKRLQNYIYTALHAKNLDSGGICFTNCRQEFQTANIDPDDETWHGVQRFRVLVSLP